MGLEVLEAMKTTTNEPHTSAYNDPKLAAEDVK
jgi:hypothetical protein